MHFACILGLDMPKAIQIRDVPDDVHAVLRVRAAKAGMSMSEYLRSELIRMAEKPTMEELDARIRSRPPTSASLQTAVDIIREHRGPIPPES
jgi:plasmid stability protein